MKRRKADAKVPQADKPVDPKTLHKSPEARTQK